MAQSSLPDYKQKQKILHKPDAQPAALIKQGEEFFAAGWYKDAVDFFAQAESAEGLAKVRQVAIDEGDVFLLKLIQRVLDEEAPEEEWRMLAERALGLGKLQFAREGFRLAGDRKGLDRVEAMIAPAKTDPTADEGEEEGAHAGYKAERNDSITGCPAFPLFLHA